MERPQVVKEFTGQWACLSNFHLGTITLDGIDYPSGEHAFQAQKANCMLSDRKAEFRKKVAEAPSPSKAKCAGRSVKIDVERWDALKDDYMRKVVYQKFLQDPDACATLLSTGAAMLVEGNTWGDTYWGRCEGKGLNKLGAILMEVRGYWWYGAKTDAAPLNEKYAYILMGW